MLVNTVGVLLRRVAACAFKLSLQQYGPEEDVHCRVIQCTTKLNRQGFLHVCEQLFNAQESKGNVHACATVVPM